MDSNERALMVALATDFSFCLFCPALVMYSCPSVRRHFRLLFRLNSKSLSPVSSDNHRLQNTKHPKVGLEHNIKCFECYLIANSKTKSFHAGEPGPQPLHFVL